jgi:hypothetical protein
MTTSMTSIRAVVIAALALPGLVCAQTGQQPPSLLGSWVGTSNSAVYGAGLHHPSTEAREAEVRFRHVEYTLKIDRQDGRNFVGVISSANHKEIVIGAFAKDLQSGVMVNENGTFTFKLANATNLDICFTQVVPQAVATPRVASCFELQKR